MSSFAECNGRLYAAVGQQIYERVDGTAPRWRLVYTNPHPRRSETGLRGLTAVPSPSGSGEVLLAAVEGEAARIIRVDPSDGTEVTDLDLEAFLSDRWQALVATRSIAVSPFPNDGGTLYFAGYDANKAPAHNTAWIFRGSLAAALGASH